jgi:hypothetical protein
MLCEMSLGEVLGDKITIYIRVRVFFIPYFQYFSDFILYHYIYIYIWLYVLYASVELCKLCILIVILYIIIVCYVFKLCIMCSLLC